MTSETKQFIRITWPFLLVIVLLFCLDDLSMDTLASIRAFVSGESFWSKAQKDAVYDLNQYALFHREVDYQNFLAAIAIPLADHRARQSLEQNPPNLQLAKQSLIQGKNNPKDVDGMVQLFRHFHQGCLLRQPVAIWREADTDIMQLSSVGAGLHAQIAQGHINSQALAPWVVKMNALAVVLAPQEDAFANALAISSRRARIFIDYFRLFLTTILLVLGGLFTRRIVVENIAYSNKLQDNENRLRNVLETSQDAVIQADADGVISNWNGQAEVVFGWLKEEVIGKNLHELIFSQQTISIYLHAIQNLFGQYGITKSHQRIEATAVRRNGDEFPIELSLSRHQWKNTIELTVFIRDITLHKASNEQLFHLAHYDQVTHLPNRILFHDRLGQELKQAQRNSSLVAVLLLDLDHFKEVNDALGHDQGDILLKQVAQRLVTILRESDTVSRLGGDEFALIIPTKNQTRIIERLAEKILKSISMPFYIDTVPVYVSASIGITVFPDDAYDIDTLLKNADRAMYFAKKHGRNGYHYFTPEMQAIAQIQANITQGLRDALRTHQFVLLYQPIVDLSDRNQKIHKAEVLIRWQHPERGLIAPSEFITIAEETGLVLEIGEWVFQQAAQQIKLWRQHYHSDFQMSINKSPVQFHRRDQTHRSWPYQLNALGLPGECMVIEITENLLLDASPYVMEQLTTLREAGCLVAIDDFGTGYSALSYLKKFAIDWIKIDKSFIGEITHSANDLALCESIIAMAHKLGIKVVAEGVETVEQRDILIAAGCDYAQGYLFSKPLIAQDFEQLFTLSVE